MVVYFFFHIFLFYYFSLIFFPLILWEPNIIYDFMGTKYYLKVFFNLVTNIFLNKIFYLIGGFVSNYHIEMEGRGGWKNIYSYCRAPTTSSWKFKLLLGFYRYLYSKSFKWFSLKLFKEIHFPVFLKSVYSSKNMCLITF